MLFLLIALACLGVAVFLITEVATEPARLRERSIKRASEYGRSKIRTTDLERLKFRERVLAPTAERLAAIPMKLRPGTTIESIQAKLLAAGLSQRLTPQNFLALKGATTVGG